jgi:hypothetical protein
MGARGVTTYERQRVVAEGNKQGSGGMVRFKSRVTGIVASARERATSAASTAACARARY